MAIVVTGSPSAAATTTTDDGDGVVVASITDGDTFRTTDDERVRLIGIDTPELQGDECFADAATEHLTELIPPGTEVRLVLDVDPEDRFERTLAYVERADDDLDVGLAMARDGFAAAAHRAAQRRPGRRRSATPSPRPRRRRAAASGPRADAASVRSSYRRPVVGSDGILSGPIDLDGRRRGAGPARRRRSRPARASTRDRAVDRRPARRRVVRTDPQLVARDGLGAVRRFRHHPGAFAVDGRAGHARRAPHRRRHRRRRPARPAARSPGPASRRKVARGSRILVEGVHDAELVERVWGDDLRHEGVVVERLDGADHLDAVVREFRPGPGRRLGVLLDHLVDGTKEARLAASAPPRARARDRPPLRRRVAGGEAGRRRHRRVAVVPARRPVEGRRVRRPRLAPTPGRRGVRSWPPSTPGPTSRRRSSTPSSG